MVLKISDVQHLAKLARLALSQSEEERMGKELSSILDYIDQLKNIDVDLSTITIHKEPQSLSSVTRPDQAMICPDDIRQAILANVPDLQVNLIKVPNVFE